MWALHTFKNINKNKRNIFHLSYSSWLEQTHRHGEKVQNPHGQWPGPRIDFFLISVTVKMTLNKKPRTLFKDLLYFGNNGAGCTTLLMYLTLLNCMLKNGSNANLTFFVFYHKKNPLETNIKCLERASGLQFTSSVSFHPIYRWAKPLPPRCCA